MEKKEELELRGKCSDVVRKNFEFWSARRAAASEGREERHKRMAEASGGALARPWRPDGRPHLVEWMHDGAQAHQDGPGAKILVEGDQSVFYEIRAFSAALDAWHGHAPGHTSLSLVSPDKKGRMPVFNGSTDGCWSDIEWQKVFELAWARSRKVFEQDGTGEQIFAAPMEKSRVVLVDDLKTSVPIFDKTLCIVLETSRENYQHLYCTDRVLTGAERHHIQSQITARFGGDLGATGGAQPHRIPGSTNYKKGRGLFVCRLVGTIGEMDGGRPLKVGEFLLSMPANEVAKEEQAQGNKETRRPSNIRLGGGGGDRSPSGEDWRHSIVMVAALRAAGHRQETVIDRVGSMLTESAAGRKTDVSYYVNRTLKKLSEAGHL